MKNMVSLILPIKLKYSYFIETRKKWRRFVDNYLLRVSCRYTFSPLILFITLMALYMSGILDINNNNNRHFQQNNFNFLPMK